MKTLKYLFFLLLIVVIGGAVYLATLDGKYDVNRKRVIKAPIEVVYNTVNEYRTWEVWGPWHEMDTTIVITYSDQTSGEGANYSWTSEKDGPGSIKTIKAEPNKSLDQILSMERHGDSDIYWRFNKVDEGTEVTWGMKGELPFLFRFMAKGMDKQIGEMNDRGLELMEEAILKEMDKHSTEMNGITEHGGGYYMYLTAETSQDKIGEKMAEMFPKIFAFMEQTGIQIAGNPFTLYHEWNEENKTARYSSCVPVKEKVITPKDTDVLNGFMKKTKAFKTTFKGNYKFMTDAWENTFKHLEENKIKIVKGGKPFEVYLASPHTEPNPAKWVTEIFIPVE